MKKYLYPSIIIASLLLSFLYACVTASREATWKTLPASQVEYERAWNIVVNAVAERFEVEVVDAQSGYLRTGWKITKKDLFGTPEERARVVVRVEERKPFKVKIKVEKQTWDSWSEKWVEAGNHEELEKEIMQDLSGRLK